MKNNQRKKQTEMQKLFPEYYGQKVILSTDSGTVDFNPDGFHNIVCKNKITYDEYLEIQIRPCRKARTYFARCFYNITLGFKGCIEKRNKNNICFNRIFVSGMYPDGECFDGKEDHVWMDNAGFEQYKIGDCVSFCAEVYRYIKTSKGKQIDFALKNPQNIKKIKPYELPSDNELFAQELSIIICDTCYLSEHCNRLFCLLK